MARWTLRSTPRRLAPTGRTEAHALRATLALAATEAVAARNVGVLREAEAESAAPAQDGALLTVRPVERVGQQGQISALGSALLAGEVVGCALNGGEAHSVPRRLGAPLHCVGPETTTVGDACDAPSSPHG